MRHIQSFYEHPSKRTCRLALMVLFILTMGSTLFAAVVTGEKAPPPIQTKTLENGLVLFVQERHTSPSASFWLFVRAGSIYEQEHLGSGISHLLEHLVGGGSTEKRSEEELDEVLSSIGGRSNAFTSRDFTAYYINTLGRYASKAIEILSERALSARITKKEFEREKKVVLRELRQDRDEPEAVLADLAATNMFRIHPAGLPVIGYPELLEKITREDVIAYYRKMYVPNNMVFVAVGDFDGDEIMGKIVECFKDAPRGKPLDFDLPKEPRQASRRIVKKEFPVRTGYMRMDFRTVRLTHPDLYPLDILSYILSEGEGSRLVKRLQDEKKLVWKIKTYSYTPGYDAGFFAFDIRANPDKLDETRKAVLEELKNLKTNPPTDTELERAKAQKIRDLIESTQTVEGIASRIGIDYLTAFDPQFSEHYTEKIQKVSREDVLRVAEHYFNEENLCVTMLVPELKKAEKAKKEAPLKRNVRKFTFDNGLRLIVGEDHSTKLVSFQAAFLAGVRFESEQTNGISNLTARLLLGGTPSRSASEIASAYDEMGGRIASGSGNNTIYVSATVLSSHFERALSIFADCVKNSVFPEGEFEKQKRILLGAIKAREDNPKGEAFHFFQKSLFRISPYRLPVTGRKESVEKITREDVARFYKSYCVPNNMVLAIFGDINPDEAKEAVDKVFFDFPKKEDLALPSPPEEPPLERSRTVFKETEKAGAVLLLGYLGTRLSDSEDRYALEVLDAILSGVEYPRGWLHRDLRTRGLVYEVHAFSQPGLERGFFAVYALSEANRIKEVQKIIFNDIEKIKKGRFTDEELALAKDLCIISNAFSRETLAERALNASLDELYGLGFDHSEEYAERIEHIRRDDVIRVARKYLSNYLLAVLEPKSKEKNR